MTLAPSGFGPSALPSQQEFAQSFFAEAVRHLVDARVLHRNGRFAASITSSMKAAEFATKAALVLEGGLGFYEKLFGSHKPLTDTEGQRLFENLGALLDRARPGLRDDLKILEALTPQPFGAKKFDADETNTEYPYLERNPHPLGLGMVVAHLVSPHARFDDMDSKKHYSVARETITLLSGAYPGSLRIVGRLPAELV